MGVNGEEVPVLPAKLVFFTVTVVGTALAQAGDSSLNGRPSRSFRRLPDDA